MNHSKSGSNVPVADILVQTEDSIDRHPGCSLEEKYKKMISQSCSQRLNEYIQRHKKNQPIASPMEQSRSGVGEEMSK